jgi:hypothetical protein
MNEGAEHEAISTYIDGIDIPEGWILRFQKCCSHFPLNRFLSDRLPDSLLRKPFSEFSRKYGSTYRGRLPSFLEPV